MCQIISHLTGFEDTVGSWKELKLGTLRGQQRSSVKVQPQLWWEPKDWRSHGGSLRLGSICQCQGPWRETRRLYECAAFGAPMVRHESRGCRLELAWACKLSWIVCVRNVRTCRAWWLVPLIPALGRQRQLDFWFLGQPGLHSEFQDSQGYRETLSRK